MMLFSTGLSGHSLNFKNPMILQNRDVVQLCRREFKKEDPNFEKIYARLQRYEDKRKQLYDTLEVSLHDMPNAQGLVNLILFTLINFENRRMFGEGPKEQLPIMPRTDYHSMFQTLTPYEKYYFKEEVIPMINALFPGRVFNDEVPKVGINSTTECPEGTFKINNITVADWVHSIVEPDIHGKDLLSPPREYLRPEIMRYYSEYSMGALGVDSQNNKPIFEIRCAKRLMFRPTVGANLKASVRKLLSSITQVTEERLRSDSDTSSEGVRREQAFFSKREIDLKVLEEDVFWETPSMQYFDDIIEKLRNLSIESETKERLLAEMMAFQQIIPDTLTLDRKIDEISNQNLKRIERIRLIAPLNNRKWRILSEVKKMPLFSKVLQLKQELIKAYTR